MLVSGSVKSLSLEAGVLLSLTFRGRKATLALEATMYLKPYSPPEVDRKRGIWGLSIIYPQPYSIYLRGTID